MPFRALCRLSPVWYLAPISKHTNEPSSVLWQTKRATRKRVFAPFRLSAPACSFHLGSGGARPTVPNDSSAPPSAAGTPQSPAALAGKCSRLLRPSRCTAQSRSPRRRPAPDAPRRTRTDTLSPPAMLHAHAAARTHHTHTHPSSSSSPVQRPKPTRPRLTTISSAVCYTSSCTDCRHLERKQGARSARCLSAWRGAKE
jgi:hypothetical protein